jgi:hypothetical protein
MIIRLQWPFMIRSEAETAFDSSPTGKEDRWYKNFRRTLRFLFVWLLGGFLVLLLCALQSYVEDPTRDGLTGSLNLLCHGVLLSLAFAAVGGLVGFLFGIPRPENQPTQHQSKNGAANDASQTPPKQEQQDSKTNLEQVSDWLTKVILGAGLTQLNKVPGSLDRMSIYFKSDLGGSTFLPMVIVIHFLVYGFFAGYLITQLFLQRALRDAVPDVEAVLAAAGTLERVKKFSAATATLEAALTTLRPDTPKSTKRDLFERLTYNALYEDEPEGFQKAIQYADQYIHEEPDYPSARIWVNLAAAIGQKYKWDSTHDAPKQALDETRKRALEAARNATAIEPRMKTLLRMLWNPNDPTKIQSEEDDLEVFFNDPDFKSLLDG